MTHLKEKDLTASLLDIGVTAVSAAKTVYGTNRLKELVQAQRLLLTEGYRLLPGYTVVDGYFYMTAYRRPEDASEIRLTLTGDGSLAFGYEFAYYNEDDILCVFVHEPTGARRFAKGDIDTYVGALFDRLFARRHRWLSAFWTPVFDARFPYTQGVQ